MTLTPDQEKRLTECAGMLQTLLHEMLDVEIRNFRTKVINAILKRRDRYPNGSPEWRAFNEFVLDLNRQQSQAETAPKQGPAAPNG